MLRDGTANAKNFSVRMNELVKQPAVRFSGNFFHVYECDNQSEEKRDTDWAVDRKEVIAWIERCTQYCSYLRVSQRGICCRIYSII